MRSADRFCVMNQEIPASVTFAALPWQMNDPTVTIGLKGGVKEHKPFLRTLNARVLIAQQGDWIDINDAQKRTMIGLVHVALNSNPFADILFMGGSSIWGVMIMKDDFNEYMSLRDLLKIPVYDIRKVVQRKRKRHDIFRERRHG